MVKTKNWCEVYIDYDFSDTAREVIIEDEAAEWTGLYDADGNPIMRFPEKVPLGYI